jgi:hypothetical protein
VLLRGSFPGTFCGANSTRKAAATSDGPTRDGSSPLPLTVIGWPIRYGGGLMVAVIPSTGCHLSSGNCSQAAGAIAFPVERNEPPIAYGFEVLNRGGVPCRCSATSRQCPSTWEGMTKFTSKVPSTSTVATVRTLVKVASVCGTPTEAV